MLPVIVNSFLKDNRENVLEHLHRVQKKFTNLQAQTLLYLFSLSLGTTKNKFEKIQLIIC